MVRSFPFFVFAMVLGACGARSHSLDGSGGDDDADADSDADTDVDVDVDTDGDLDVLGQCGESGRCLLVSSARYRELEGPQRACTSNDGFYISYRHGIGSHECSSMVESEWRIERPNGGEAIFHVRVESHVCYCEEICCPGGCGVEDVFDTEVFIPTAGFGAGTYFITVGEETLTVRVDRC